LCHELNKRYFKWFVHGLVLLGFEIAYIALQAGRGKSRITTWAHQFMRHFILWWPSFWVGRGIRRWGRSMRLK
jgi:hypothetical protein